MGQKSRWTLPLTVYPDAYRRFVLCVPDDPYYIAAFQGLLIELTYSKNWQRDDAHTAALVSRLWQEVLSNQECALIGDDNMQFRQNGCKLEFSIDCVHWETLYDPTACIAKGATQHGPGGTLELGDCATYAVTLQGNGRYLLPVPVEEGYRITISATDGGWNDGSGLAGWYCPDGTPFVLGACIGSKGHVTGDPSPIAYHGEVIAHYGSTYQSASSGTIIIPAGEPSEALEFLMNDASLSDNYGSISFVVEVCAAPVETWSHTFDFTVDNGGWAVRSAGEGVYTGGTGWSNTTTGDNKRLVVQRTVPGAVNILTVTAVYDWAFGSGSLSAAGKLVRTFLSGSTVTAQPITDQGTDETVTLSQDASSDLLEFNLYACEGSGCTGGSVLLKSVTVTGKGTDPF